MESRATGPAGRFKLFGKWPRDTNNIHNSLTCWGEAQVHNGLCMNMLALLVWTIMGLFQASSRTDMKDVLIWCYCRYSTLSAYILTIRAWEFHGGPVARFTAQGAGSVPGQGTKILQAEWPNKQISELFLFSPFLNWVSQEVLQSMTERTKWGRWPLAENRKLILRTTSLKPKSLFPSTR